ncbi:GspH/FimT family pseudopilin [Alginatibacterium sediminis]|nr:GspH/FimT family protein [Alginatibacterium sediminis]
MQNGFTLLELLFSLVIVSIGMSLSFVGYQRLISEFELKRSYALFQHQTRVARQEALNSGVTMVYCALDSNLNQCTSDFNSGFDLFVDHNNNGAHEPSEPIIWITSELPTQIRIHSNLIAFRFLANGYLATAGRIDLCGEGLDKNYALVLSRSASSRLELSDDCSF